MAENRMERDSERWNLIPKLPLSEEERDKLRKFMVVSGSFTTPDDVRRLKLPYVVLGSGICYLLDQRTPDYEIAC